MFELYEGCFFVYVVLMYKYWLGFVGFVYLLFGMKIVIVVKYLFYCSRNIC